MKTIFWNVDTQYDFMHNDDVFRGALAVPGASHIESNLEKLTDLAREKKIKVVNTADYHTLDSAEISKTPDFKTTFPPHCLRYTKGADFVPETRPNNPYAIDWGQKIFDHKEVVDRRNIVLYKDDFDIFKGSPHTEKVLELIKPDRAIVYGVATNVCVNYAVLGLLSRGVQVYVPTDAIKELPNLPLEQVLETWRDNGAVLIKTEELANYL